MSRSLPALVSEDATDELMASSNENNNERPIGRKATKERKKSGKSLLEQKEYFKMRRLEINRRNLDLNG
ncbi:hypothetical protein LIER_22169 [Lithospermum erythrorhizon]|uniref:Uncharacterized protein n=1 Tax=Lithospermum erythrorhizon TaxID=34254 RepID=A0AAV3QSW4_LITER